ncbi:MAG: alpha/beta fold hydrolase [Proteobacteria bacterium]|nr:alpha/beta fold hydrolase [Pseudomonadota bacterium]
MTMTEVINEFTHEGVTLSVRDRGTGPVVAVISGWGYGSLMGEVAFGTLRDAGYRVITFDLPGTGCLKDRSAFVHIPRLSRAVAGYLRAQNAAGATVVGHSFGTLVAQEMALSEDDVVGRLVLVSPVAGVGGIMPDMNAAMDMLGRLMSGQSGLLTFLFPPSYLGKLKTTLGDVFEELERPASSAALSGQVWAATRWSTFGRLQSMYQDVLILHGDKDPLSPLHGAQSLARQIPKAKLQVLEKCGYLPFIECKKETLGALSAFLPSAK